jgi:Phosphotransferase enzyme family
LLLPGAPASVDVQAELIVLAPSVHECRDQGWLERAACLVASRLAPEGIAYLLVTRWWRPRTARLLRDKGLVTDVAIAHVPNWTESRYLVPLNSVSVQYALSQLLVVPGWTHLLAGAAVRVPGAWKILPYLPQTVGLVARRPGSRPLVDWLCHQETDPPDLGSVLISTSHRGKSGAAVVHGLSARSGQPSVIAKLALTAVSNRDGVGEAEILERLGPVARAAGALIPQPLATEYVGGRPVLLQTAIRGRTAAALLGSEPEQLPAVIKRLVDWLEHWNSSTLVIKPVASDALVREIMAVAALLAPFLDRGQEYLDWLATRCAAAVGRPMPLVAAHCDLTMANVLLDEQGELGIVDWESARVEVLPLGDFFCAAADASAATRCYVDRLGAFKACFFTKGAHAATMRELTLRLTRAMRIQSDIVTLCFHACWLHHASNELQAAHDSDTRPFLEIVRWLATNRDSIDEWLVT